MAKKKSFEFHERVRVKMPGRRPFIGRVYGESKMPGEMRKIYVEEPSGAGVAYPVMFVAKL